MPVRPRRRNIGKHCRKGAARLRGRGRKE